MMELDGKVAVVTGAATGIGRAIARRFVKGGAKVVIDYIGESGPAEQLVALLQAIGGDAIAVAADVSDPAHVAMLFDRTSAHFGRLDVLVNNAGIERKSPFVEVSQADWDEVIAVNLTGPFLCAQQAARRMIAQGGGGRIINISSIHEDLAMPANSPYCAAKGGLRMLMRTVALELAPHGILVNNVAPGAVDTPINAALSASVGEMEKLAREIPLHRVGRPEEIAEVCAFLASEAASYCTAATFFVDGGMAQQAGSL